MGMIPATALDLLDPPKPKHPKDRSESNRRRKGIKLNYPKTTGPRPEHHRRTPDDPATILSKPAWELSGQEAAYLLYCVHKARESFAHFCLMCYANYLFPRHLLKLIDLLQIIEHTADARTIVTMPPRYGKPGSVDTLVLMKNGAYKRLGDVRVGDQVIGHSGTPCRVAAVHKQGVLPVVKIATVTGREFLFEASHPFLTPSGWVNAGDLRPGMSLAVISGAQTRGDCTRSIAEFMLAGYLIGDGSVGRYNGRLSALFTSADPDQISNFLETISLLGFSAREKAGNDKKGKTKHFNLSGGIRAWLEETGIGGSTSHTKIVPDWVYRGDSEHVAAFLGAYFSCDGTMNHRQQEGKRPDAIAEFYSVSRNLLAGVQSLLIRFGINAYLRDKRGRYKGKTHRSYRLTISGTDAVCRFRDRIWVSGNKGKALRAFSYSRSTFDERFLPDRVVSVTDGGTAECRCLTVEKDHTFTANDVVVHNSLTVSTLFPAWWLGRNPDKLLITSSYAAGLSWGFGSRVREIMESHPYQLVFPGILPSGRAAGSWGIQGHKGSLFATGVTSGMTGRGADMLIIDDPIRDAMYADSESWREKIWDWYCYHPDTEILTQDGWKLIGDAQVGEFVATMSPKTRGIEYHPVSRTFEQDCDDGELVCLDQRNGAAFAVTTKHKMYIGSIPNQKKLNLVQADHLPAVFYLPRTGIWRGTQPKYFQEFQADHLNGKSHQFAMVDWLEFLGFYLAEGNVDKRDHVVLTQIKETGRLYARALLDRLGVTYWENATGFRFRNSVIARYLRKLGPAKTKYVPREILDYSPKYLECLLRGLLAGDGQQVHERRYRYTTISKQLSDDFCELAFKCGYKVAVSSSQVDDGIRQRTYAHSIRKNGFDGSVAGHNGNGVYRESYSGKVQCVTVEPYHTLVIRYKGKVSINGNTNVAYTRLHPGAPVFVIATRWHHDDLTGRLLRQNKDEDADSWNEVYFPALLPNGKPLWPERFNMLALKRIRSSVGSRTWSALYQGKPTPAEGHRFKRWMFRKVIHAIPGNVGKIRWIRYWDKAGTESGGDWTVGVLLGQDDEGRFYVADVQRGQWSALLREQLIRDTAEVDATNYQKRVRIGLEQEPGSGGKESAEATVRRLAGFRVMVDKPSGSLELRADPLAVQFEAGNVYLVRGEWNEAFINEFCQFPLAVHDDQVAATAGGFKLLTNYKTFRYSTF